MKRFSNQIILLLVISFSLLKGEPQIVSAFNKKQSICNEEGLRFIVTGHIHGQSENVSGFPASTLLASIDTLNSFKPSFLACTGDMFLFVDSAAIRNYRSSFLNRIDFPFFNVRGNHDNTDLYDMTFGPLWYSFSCSRGYFIFLDTEVDNGNIEGDQLKFLQSELKKAEPAKAVFIFTHRPVWSEENPRYKRLFTGNTRTEIGSNNFEKDVIPLLKALSSPVYWFSGSLADSPVSYFYDRDPRNGITFINTAIRNLPRDGIIIVDVDTASRVSFKTFSLTGRSLNPLESYNLEYWKKLSERKGSSFNFRLIPYIAWRMINHYFFWTGFIVCLIFSFTVFYLVIRARTK